MREVFNLQRTGIYWWGLLTATVFLIPGAWLRAVVQFLRTTDWFQPDRAPFTWIGNAGTWIDAATEAVVRQIQFDPRQALIYIGPWGLANLSVAIILSIVLIAFVFLFYARATKTRGIWDDILGMLAIYIVVRIIGVAGERLNLPILDFIRREEPRSYLLIITAFMLMLMAAGKAGEDSRVFFKVLFEGLLIWFLIIPGPTVLALAWILELPVNINSTLQTEPNIRNYYAMVVAVWAILGLALAMWSIYTSGKPATRPQGVAGDLDQLKRAIDQTKKKLET